MTIDNSRRAEFAQAAVEQFQCVCRTDDCDAIADLLCNLMHLCDARNEVFEAALSRARFNYEAEVDEEAESDNA
jgi:hypothetical protein